VRMTPLLAVLLAIAGCSSTAQPVDISSFVKPGTPAGACLVEYNSALVPAGADPCCRTSGGPNNCDLGTRCNDLSGSDCCLFYSTDNDAFPAQCCWYEQGWPHDTNDGSPEATACLALVGSH
jgi:hypothetical protein